MKYAVIFLLVILSGCCSSRMSSTSSKRDSTHTHKRIHQADTLSCKAALDRKLESATTVTMIIEEETYAPDSLGKKTVTGKKKTRVLLTNNTEMRDIGSIVAEASKELRSTETSDSIAEENENTEKEREPILFCWPWLHLLWILLCAGAMWLLFKRRS